MDETQLILYISIYTESVMTARNKLLGKDNTAQRELNYVCRRIGLDTQRQLFRIVGILDTHGYRWFKQARGLGSPYSLRMIHLLRLKQLEDARGIPLEKSRFLDEDYDWSAHWHHWEQNVDVSRDYYRHSDRYGGRT
jgi:hypothetical protein